ncbi:MAG: hypothetical protein GW947_01060 [Candidatus Pacebacteria bacterium]|nr:hypothetical protein [Candidatus Paceibacterota bacterium]PIR60734.1 MAG: hypothetical protein COU68_02300 [Candidatus Pacebacteria bacterium CG10_big_fil_rev_8_21_14_0_10_45_6]
MLKEIRSKCTFDQAKIIEALAETYAVSIETSPHSQNPNLALIVIKELQEDTIYADFFGAMYTLLQENPKPEVLATVPAVVSSPVVERPATAQIQDTLTITFWRRMKSFLKPEAKIFAEI